MRQSSVVERFQFESQLLKIRANRHPNKYRQVDQEMNNLLKRQFDDNTTRELKTWWIDECEDEEAKSQERWQTKQKLLEKYEEEFNNDNYLKPRK